MFLDTLCVEDNNSITLASNNRFLPISAHLLSRKALTTLNELRMPHALLEIDRFISSINFLKIRHKICFLSPYIYIKRVLI